MAIGRFDAIVSCQGIVSECLKHERKHGFGGVAGRRSVLELLKTVGLRHIIGL